MKSYEENIEAVSIVLKLYIHGNRDVLATGIKQLALKEFQTNPRFNHAVKQIVNYFEEQK